MPLVSVFVIVAGTVIDLVAAWHLVRGWKETSADRIRTIGSRARMLAATALFLSFVAPVAGVALAFKTVESVDPAQRAVALGERISEAMNGAVLGLIFAVPTLLIALLLMGRSRAIERQRPAKNEGVS